MKQVFKVDHEHLGSHVHVRVFSGPDVQHFANNGKLVFNEAEWAAFQLFLRGSPPMTTEATITIQERKL